MISLSTITPQASNNSIRINESLDSSLNQNTARVTLVPTLDGGAVAIHGGISDVDRPILVRANITKSQEAVLWDMFENNLFLLLAVVSTLYTVSIKKLKTDNGKLDMSILVTNKEN